ncbi:hypothetical protein F4778DRAFT_318462 [Xylariomycetidae sp. FL2044]|nr:hypothetical protein F4778DRAFT_318462 [Xylariomycetidae sp. FL2044]
MDQQPAAKKRRLAPKLDHQASPSHPPSIAHEAAQPTQPYPLNVPLQVQEPPPPPERHDFESFARHLQDAAMLIYRHTQKSPYHRVSVLLLRWEDDNAIEPDLAALHHVLHSQYNYRISRWNIPSVSNPSIKLGVRMASFLEQAHPDHLLIIYYAGHGFVDADDQLFWACNTRSDSPKLKWTGFRCLFEEATSDMLLLLDTCAAREPHSLGGPSVKQVLAAGSPEQNTLEIPMRSFTAHLTNAFAKFGAGRPFTADQLYHEVAIQRQQEFLQNSGLTNGASKNTAITDKLPVFYTMSSGKGQGLTLTPLPPSTEPPPSPRLAALGDVRSPGEDGMHPSTVADLTFDEPRVLVCTTFVGEASPDMSSFHQWLHHAPPIAARIAVEGMFLGPPTMLLISMPQSVWNVVQHDKVCCFLGYVNSHNMTHLYKKLVGSIPVNKASTKDVEDGRILLEARELASAPALAHRHEHMHRDPNNHPPHPETPARPDSIGRVDPMSVSQASGASGAAYSNSTPASVLARKDDVEESAEMQEAAEQLKALRHVRRTSADVSSRRRRSSALEHAPDSKHGDLTSQEANEAGMDESHYDTELGTPSSRPHKPHRRSLQKQPPRQETRCTLCSHTPFKDLSTLRKHIAAAHTRPFPCAFAFAGCASTFGSKNEWKRHIASQHLCLQYYRCSACPQSTVEGKGNEFNRKDLFTQHLRRMHAPFQIKKAIAKGDSKLQADWEMHVKEMQQSCLVTRRKPPQRSSCPKPDCSSSFEGSTSWDEWTEHVGRHMEKGEANRMGVDRLLAKWALDEGIIEPKGDGEYRLCAGSGGGMVDKESHHHHNSNSNSGSNSNSNVVDYHSDSNKRDPEERTIIAASTMIERMDVDG